jgi:hypothetical protein
VEFVHGRRSRYRGFLHLLMDGVWHLQVVIYQGDDYHNVPADEFFEAGTLTLTKQLLRVGLNVSGVFFDKGELVIKTNPRERTGVERQKIKMVLQDYYPEHDGIACEW